MFLFWGVPAVALIGGAALLMFIAARLVSRGSEVTGGLEEKVGVVRGESESLREVLGDIENAVASEPDVTGSDR